mgnify:CR=1 FL=1
MTLEGRPIPRWILAVAGVVLLGLALYALSGVLTPIFSALTIAYLLDPVVEQLHPHRFPVGFRGEDIDHVAAYPIARTMEVDIVSLVLEFGKAAQQVALIDGIATIDMQHHLQVRARITEPVDRRHRCHHDRIGTFQ